MSTPPGAFAPPPPPAAAPVPKRWLKNALIGCGAVAVLLAAGFLGLLLYLKQRPEALTDMMVKQIESRYAPDVTSAEKEGLRSAYADFRAALREHRVSRGTLEKIRTALVSGGDVTREQVRELTAAFREGAAAPGSAPGSTPVPRPSP